MFENQELIGSYFLELWPLNSKADAARFESGGEGRREAVEAMLSSDVAEEAREEEEEREESLTELDTLNSSGGFFVVGPNKHSVQYPNVNLHSHDVGVVQANLPQYRRRQRGEDP